MDKIDFIEKEQMRGDIPDFKSGDTVKVFVKIVEGSKERIQVFEGVVIKKTRGNSRAHFTVRKISYGGGVERTFPLHSPVIDRVQIVTGGKVRRAKLFYLRGRKGKERKIKEADKH
ncbi:MAG: 50S ribosomal protein L19 [Syntrophaceae bacterium]